MESIVSKFYKYLSGEIELPYGHIIGNDCVHKHGKDGKTVRKVRKNNSNASNCVRCLQNSVLKVRRNNIEKKYPSRDLAALSSVEIAALEQDPFDF